MFLILFRFLEGNIFGKLKEILSKKLVSINIVATLKNETDEIDFVRSINSDTQEYRMNVIQPLGKLLSELILTFILIITLFVINFYATFLVIASILSIVGIFSVTSKRILQRAGDLRLRSELGKSQYLKAYIDVKEILLMYPEKEKYLATKFDENLVSLKKSESITYFLKNIPRPILELSVFTSVLILYLFSNNLSEFIVVLSTLAVAFYKVVPAITAVTNSTLTLMYGWPLHQKFVTSINQEIYRTKQLNIPGQKIQVRVKDVGVPVLERLKQFTFQVVRGKLNIVTGASGAGKSTLLRAFLGLNTQLELDYEDFGSELHKCCFISQHPQVIPGNLYTNVAIDQDITLQKRQKIDDICSKLKFDERLREFNDLQEINLSGGQRIRLGLMRALYCGAEILILDEPTAGLDLETANAVVSILENLDENITLIVASHDPNLQSKAQNTIKIP